MYHTYTPQELGMKLNRRTINSDLSRPAQEVIARLFTSHYDIADGTLSNTVRQELLDSGACYEADADGSRCGSIGLSFDSKYIK